MHLTNISLGFYSLSDRYWSIDKIIFIKDIVTRLWILLHNVNISYNQSLLWGYILPIGRRPALYFTPPLTKALTIQYIHAGEGGSDIHPHYTSDTSPISTFFKSPFTIFSPSQLARVVTSKHTPGANVCFLWGLDYCQRILRRTMQLRM